VLENAATRSLPPSWQRKPPEQDQQPAGTPADQPPGDPARRLAMPDGHFTLPDAEAGRRTRPALCRGGAETRLRFFGPEDPLMRHLRALS